MSIDGGWGSLHGRFSYGVLCGVVLAGLWAVPVKGMEPGSSMEVTANPPSGNQLADSASAYLREAVDQPVNWRPWGPAAFEEAQREDKPILLDIGAVWCHWCHVMDVESYENEEIAQIINQHYVAIKVDMDERPDIDRRYQEAVRALTGHGGWPLTVFLTPEGQVFFGGTYFPPDSRDGRPGLKVLLPKIVEVFKTQKAKVYENAQHLSRGLRQLGLAVSRPGEISESIIEEITSMMTKRFDSNNGGFGDGVKFPAGSALELALARYDWNRDPRMLEIVVTTLDAMARGGLYDHLGGGFFRYATDSKWRIPHFEKMNYVNAELLMNYLHAYQATGNTRYRHIALGIMNYLNHVLSDQERGGFYAHQDADMTRADDGDYYTWTVEEVRQALPKEEAEVILRLYDIQPQGEMPGNPAKNVLFLAKTPEVIAQELNQPLERVVQLIRQGKAHLLQARMARKTPLVDRTIYIDRNGMLISAYLEAFQVLGDQHAKAFALKTVDAVLTHAYRKGQGMAHAYFDGKARMFGLLNDNVYMARALLAAFEVTAQRRYLETAKDLMDGVLRRFWDGSTGGFWDRSPEGTALAALTRPLKDVDDTPFASSNGIAALTLDRLADLTNHTPYHHKARDTLKAFAGAVRGNGHLVAAYGLAAHYHLHPSAQAVIIGPIQDEALLNIWHAALTAYRPGKLVAVYDPSIVDLERLPPSVVAAIKVFGIHQKPRAYVCAGETCAPPTTDAKEVTRLMTEYGRKNLELSAPLP